MIRDEHANGRSRWIWGFSFLFLAHAALVFWFNERSQTVPPQPKPQPFIFIATDKAGAERVASLSAVADPTLFALPNERGFSGDAWLNFRPDDVTLSNWSAPPDWLPLRVSELGSSIVQAAQTNRLPTDSLLDDLRGVAPFELRIPAPLASTGSSFVVEGTLALRRFQSLRSLPSATNVDLFSNTVLRVAVNADGVVESVMLSGQCGLSTLDDAAVGVARGLSFDPLPLPRQARESAVPEEGRLVFSWHSVPPPLTNGLTSSP